MMKRLLCFAGKGVFRLLLTGVCFALGWAAYVAIHPRPLLQDRWAALRESRPGSGPGLPAGSGAGGRAGGTGLRTTGTGPAFSMDDLMAMRDPVGQGLALMRAVKTADAATCREWLETVRKHPHRMLRQAASAAGDDYQERASVFRQWAHRDPAAARAAAGGQFEAEICQGILESDPEQAAARWQAAFPGWPVPLNLLEFALKEQIGQDPAGAMQAVPAGPDHRTNELRSSLFGAWMDRDPEAALGHARETPDPAVRQQLLAQFAQRFPGRMEPLLASMDAADQVPLALAVARGKTGSGSSTAEAARWLQSKVHGPDFLPSLTRLVAEQRGMGVGQLDEILTLCPDAAAQDQLLGDTANSGWMMDSLKRWLKAQPPDSLNAARQVLAFRLLAPAEASALVPGGISFAADDRNRMLGGLTNRWNPADPSGVAAQIAALPASLQEAAAGSFLGQPWFWIREDGGSRVDDRVPPGSLTGIYQALPPAVQASTALGFAWRQPSDPAAAAAVLANSPAPSSDPAAMAVHEKVAQQWAGQDAVAAAEWIQTLAPGPSRDAAAVVLIETQAATDPAGALAWAETLQDPVAILRARRALNLPSSSTAP